MGAASAENTEALRDAQAYQVTRTTMQDDEILDPEAEVDEDELDEEEDMDADPLENDDVPPSEELL